MDLCSVTVSGFRRFKSRSTLRTNGKLVALLGPNEAGKSSLLRAISLLTTDAEPATNDFTRGETRENFLIEGRFFLSHDDIKAAGLVTSTWFTISKKADGSRTSKIEPIPPTRDISHRNKLARAIDSALRNPKFAQRVEENSLSGLTNQCLTILAREDEDLDADTLSAISSSVSSLTSLIKSNDIKSIQNLPNLLTIFLELESRPNPTKFAFDALKSRVPEILFFDEQARALASEYDLTSLSESVPLALENLCQIADLDIQVLLEAQRQGRTDDITTLEHRANATLKARFEEDWQQSGISVSLRIQDARFAVQVVNKKMEFTSFAERSDGLRQFVALQTFAAGKRNSSSILLIDEADQKLHYDAQADLVQMLARQRLASKVIYTTHSAGCMPEDLGNGVRFARPRRDDETRSEIANKFWAENEPGFAPLLFGMGASTLAFFPTRNAVLLEGPGDMLLLPTMFRESLKLEVLGFQFVPGLSCAEDEEALHAPAIGKDGGILYLVDGDVGGNKIKDKLVKRSVHKDDIFQIKTRDGSAQELEDFLDVGILLESVNKYLAKHFPKSTPYKKEEFSKSGRMAALEKSFRQKTHQKLSKVELAYEILDIVAENPDRTLLSKDRAATFRSIASAVLKRMETRDRQ